MCNSTKSLLFSVGSFWGHLFLVKRNKISGYEVVRYSKQTGFSIEGGTRRLIGANFALYSRLLCLSRFLCLCFVLQVCLSCFRITLPFLAWLWSKQNRETCLLFWTWSIKPFYLSAGLHGETWEWVRMLQNGGQASPRSAERTYHITWLLAKRIKESLRLKILRCLDVEIVFF